MFSHTKWGLVFSKIINHGLNHWFFPLKLIYSEKATNFSTLILTVCTAVKSKVEILQNIVAFSEYMNFNFKFFGSLRNQLIFYLFKWMF